MILPHSHISLPVIYLQISCLYQILVLWSTSGESPSEQLVTEKIEEEQGVFGDGDKDLVLHWLSNL